MKRIFAALAAALCCVSGAATMSGPTVDQAVIEGEATPQKLSAFGFGMTADSYRPTAAVGYTLRTPLFSDYAAKDRFVYIPNGRKARVAADGTIEFPVGTVLFKSFGWPDHNGGKPVETRLLIHRASGWVALPYIWDADGKDATLALGGRRVPVTFKSPDGETHSIRYAVPNKNQCKECHSKNGVIEPIGPKTHNFLLEPEVAKAVRSRYFENSRCAETNDAAMGRPQERQRRRPRPRLSRRQLRALPQSGGQRVEQRAVPALDRRSERRELRHRQTPDRGGTRQRRDGFRDRAGRPRAQLHDLSPRKHRSRHRDARGWAVDGA